MVNSSKLVSLLCGAALMLSGCGSATAEGIGTADGIALNAAMDDIADYCGAAAAGGDYPDDKVLDARETILDTAARISGASRDKVLPKMNATSGIEVCDPEIAAEVQEWIDSEPKY